MMKQTMTYKRYLIHILGFLSCVFFAVACSKEETSAPIEDSETQEQPHLTLDMDMDEIPVDEPISTETGLTIPESELRMYFENRKNGVAFRYDDGEKIKGVLFFRQGRTIKKEDVTFTVKEHDSSKKAYKLNPIDVSLPKGINANHANLEVAGVIGGINGRVEGGKCLVDIPSSAELIASNDNQKYTVPMYFPFTPVRSLGKGKFGMYSKFHIYGAVVGLHVTNAHRYAYKLKEVELKTAALTTKGTMDLTESVASEQPTEPKWTSKQKAESRQMVQLTSLNDNYEIAARSGSKYFFFWVMPKPKVSANTKLDIGLKSFRTSERPGKSKNSEPDVIATTTVKKALQWGKVHRVPTIKAPMPQDLIFSQVFVGSGDEALAIEIYNASDRTINLNDYYIRSYDRKGKKRDFFLIRPDHSEFRILMNETGETYPTFARMPSPRGVDVDRKRFTLAPKQMVLYLTTTVAINKSQMQQRKSTLRWIFNLSATAFPGIKLDPQKGYYELRRKDGNRGEIVDVFLKFKAGQHHNIDSYTMVRKPYHDRPREYMKLGQMSDWVVRERKENVDWGWRFGFASGDNSNYYLSDNQQRAGVVFRDPNLRNPTPYPIPSWGTRQ